MTLALASKAERVTGREHRRRRVNRVRRAYSLSASSPNTFEPLHKSTWRVLTLTASSRASLLMEVSLDEKVAAIYYDYFVSRLVCLISCMIAWRKIADDQSSSSQSLLQRLASSSLGRRDADVVDPQTGALRSKVQSMKEAKTAQNVQVAKSESDNDLNIFPCRQNRTTTVM